MGLEKNASVKSYPDAAAQHQRVGIFSDLPAKRQGQATTGAYSGSANHLLSNLTAPADHREIRRPLLVLSTRQRVPGNG